MKKTIILIGLIISMIFANDMLDQIRLKCIKGDCKEYIKLYQVVILDENYQLIYSDIVNNTFNRIVYECYRLNPNACGYTVKPFEEYLKKNSFKLDLTSSFMNNFLDTVLTIRANKI